MGIYKRGKTWYIDYYDQYGKRHREAVGPNKRLAEQVLAKRKTEVAEGRFLDKKSQGKVKFEDFAQEFIVYYSKPNKKSWKRDVLSVSHLVDFFKGKYLYEISSLDVEKYKTKRLNEVTPATINRELACLKTLFNKAIQWGKISHNPVKGVKLYKENNQRVRYLEDEEIKMLLDHCPDDLRPIVVMALNTGMRLSEILGLKWEDVDFTQKIIYITNSKSGEKREVPMNDLVCDMLRKMRQKSNDDFVFTYKSNRADVVSKCFRKVCKSAGIKNFRFHDLRHTFASHLVMNGVNLKAVQELLGHKTFNMTLRYAHLSPDHKRKAVNDLGNKMQKLVTIWTQQEEKEDSKVADKPLQKSIRAHSSVGRAADS